MRSSDYDEQAAQAALAKISRFLRSSQSFFGPKISCKPGPISKLIFERKPAIVAIIVFARGVSSIRPEQAGLRTRMNPRIVKITTNDNGQLLFGQVSRSFR